MKRLRRNLFQFHKVRLKAQWERSNPSTFNMFQFHKVRLKAAMIINTIVNFPSFNSIRYD